MCKKIVSFKLGTFAFEVTCAFGKFVKQSWKLCQQYFTKFRPHHPEEICGRHFKKLQSVNQRPLSCTANQRQPLLCTAIFGSSHALKSTKQSWKLCQQYSAVLFKWEFIIQMRAAAKHTLPLLPLLPTLLLPSFSSFLFVSEQNGGPKKASNTQIRGTEGV